MKVLFVAVAAISLGCGFGYGLSHYLSGDSSGFDPLEPLGKVEVDPWLQPVAGDQQPRLVIDSEVAELGVLPLDATVSHEFQISNEGTAPLHLRADRIIYTEYEHELKKNNLAPGESTTLSISWTPRSNNVEGKWMQMEPPGDFSRMLSLFSNDPEAPRKLLGVQGILVPPAVIENDGFDLGMCDPDAGQVLETQVYAYHTDALEIMSPTMSDYALKDLFEVTTSRMSADELAALPEIAGVKPLSGFDVAITVKPGLPMGEFRQEIRLPMQPRSKMQLSINVAGETASDFKLAGKTWHRRMRAVNMGNVLAKEGATTEVSAYFTGEYRDKINLQFESSEPSSIRVEFLEPVQSADGKTTIYGIKIIVPPNSPPVEYSGPIVGGELGRMRFRTDHPKLPHFDIPILITISP